MIQKPKKSSTEPINEATSDNSGGRGSFVSPLKPGKRIFDKSQLSPFDTPVSKFFSQLLATDSYDGKMDTPKKDRKNIESKARIESKKTKLESNKLSKENGAKKINEWIEINEETVDEDLAVWFGTKKKPKGSNQPKGPWVNICRKVDGKHPPCGRKKATDKSYPKCRAAGVAGKMTDAQKKAACAQKRRAEKSNPKIGTGNKPKMVSYKPKKKTNEEIEKIIKRIIIESESELKFIEHNLDYRYGQHDMVMYAYLNDELVAKVTYALYQGRTSIGIIESFVKGKGYGYELMKELAKKYGIENIDPGYMTDTGAKMWDKVVKYYDFDVEKYRESLNKHYPIEIIDKIKDEPIKRFVKNIVDKGYNKGWEILLKEPELDRIRKQYVGNIDIDDIASIAEWIKGSKMEYYDTEVPPPSNISDLVDYLTN